MRNCLLVLPAILMFSLASGQDRKMGKPALETALSDVFSGNILSGGVIYATYLTLNHCRYCDMGTYSLVTIPRGSVETSTMQQGEWTVLRGSAKDRNATVVELDDSKLRGMYYYLRTKNGDLQQLDSLLRDIKPVKEHMLKKQ